MKKLSLFIIVGFASCNPSQVVKRSDAAKAVPEAQIGECEFVKTISCRLGENFVSYDTNVDNCTNKIQNDASDAGANRVVMQGPQVDATGAVWSNHCKTCVAMSAQAYRCDGVTDSVKSSEPVETK